LSHNLASFSLKEMEYFVADAQLAQRLGAEATRQGGVAAMAYLNPPHGHPDFSQFAGLTTTGFERTVRCPALTGAQKLSGRFRTSTTDLKRSFADLWFAC
jgi:hypothetical protein